MKERDKVTETELKPTAVKAMVGRRASESGGREQQRRKLCLGCTPAQQHSCRTHMVQGEGGNVRVPARWVAVSSPQTPHCMEVLS